MTRRRFADTTEACPSRSTRPVLIVFRKRAIACAIGPTTRQDQHLPQTITLDGYAASHRAVRELKADGSLPTDTKQRSSKYLNNLIGLDHRTVKVRIAVMPGFKRFRHLALTIASIELMHRIRKSSSGYHVSVFEVELRPQSGMQCSGRIMVGTVR